MFSNNSLDDETKKDEIEAVEKEIASTVMDQQRESLRKDIACLQNTKMKLKEQIVGPKVKSTEAVVIFDPDSGF